MYEYQAIVLNVVDGDTIDVRVDLGMEVKIDQRIRMLGYNSPEVRGVERERGLAAKAFLVTMLPVGSQVILNTVKDRREKYGRYLGTVYVEGQSMTINDLMVSEGHGNPTDSDGHPLGKAQA
jgi:micrococcal nuclease